ncbi:MAG: hypothetical protein ICV69_14275 [Thermoleophilaceae bacterium]|nr:hypothetical protein [Thermoleophilaceae bacterium]
MRNPVLHEALRNFALEAAALLTDDVKAGAEVEFDVVHGGGGGRSRPSLYRYAPRTRAFVAERWPRLRELPGCSRATEELGAGAAAWLRVNGLRGERAEPALQAMLDRLYEDSTSFGFPEERFERLYREVESILYRDAVRARVVAPLPGVRMDAERVDFGDGLSLRRGDRADAPHEAVWPEGGDETPAVLCSLEQDVEAGTQLPVAEAEERFRRLVTAMRLWGPGAVSLGGPGWRRSDDGPWSPVPLGGSAGGRGEGWTLAAGEEARLREFFALLDEAAPAGVIAWSLRRFEMGCERSRDAEALSDYLLALRALLDATSDAGEASLGLRVAALCAEEGSRRAVQRRIQAAIALERFVMGGAGRPPAESPRDLVADVEAHVRALLRDVLCEYLDPDLKGVADDILLETLPEPTGEIRARDLRKPQDPGAEDAVPEADTSELEPVGTQAAPVQQEIEGVTASADWGWGEADDQSSPV